MLLLSVSRPVAAPSCCTVRPGMICKIRYLLSTGAAAGAAGAVAGAMQVLVLCYAALLLLPCYFSSGGLPNMQPHVFAVNTEPTGTILWLGASTEQRFIL